MLHEPLFIPTIKSLLPDVYELLCRFIEAVVLGNIKDKRKTIKQYQELIKIGDDEIVKYKQKELTYEWTPFSLACLYGLLGKEDIFSNTNTLLRFIDFCKNDEQAMEYVMFMLANQLPITKEQVPYKPNRVRIKDIVSNILKNKEIGVTINETILKNLESIHNYFLTNPFTDNSYGVKHSFQKIADYFEKETYKGSNHNTIVNDVGSLKTFIDSFRYGNRVINSDIKHTWNNIRGFLRHIKRHTVLLDDFLKSYDKNDLYSLLHTDENGSLISIITKLDNAILKEQVNDENYEQYLGCIEDMKNNFTNEDSLLRDLFENYSCNIVDILRNKIKDMKVGNNDFSTTFLKHDISINNQQSHNSIIKIHEKILVEIYQEIIKNIIDHSEKNEVELGWIIDIENCILRIKAKKNFSKNTNNKGIGLERIKKLMNCYEFKTKIEESKEEQPFIMHLIFKQ